MNCATHFGAVPGNTLTCEEAALVLKGCHVHGGSLRPAVCAECAEKQGAYRAWEAALPPSPEPWQMRCTGSVPGIQPAIAGCGRVFFTNVAGHTTCPECAAETAVESARAAHGWRPEDMHMRPPFPYYRDHQR